jgi:hypothetical protein
MILYNVTINVEEDFQDEWFDWMKNEHIPNVMKTNMFIDYKMYRIISRLPEETGITYSIQYHASTIEDFEIYRTEYAPVLQQQTLERFGESRLPMAFRTILEEV